MANTYLSKAALKLYSPSGGKTQANLTLFPARPTVHHFCNLDRYHYTILLFVTLPFCYYCVLELFNRNSVCTLSISVILKYSEIIES